jgi:hypothetical protein
LEGPSGLLGRLFLIAIERSRDGRVCDFESLSEDVERFAGQRL